jgi:CHAT domain-containing protein/Tfp pilus assembly protein PilF
MTQVSGDHSASDCRDRAVFWTLFLLFSLPAFGSTLAKNQTTTQQANQDGEARALEPGNPIKRELAGGQRHTYQIRLNSDQFLKVVVEQRGIDVAIQVSGPDGKQVAEFDTERQPRGQEPVSLLADGAGDYRLSVRPALPGGATGAYEIRIEEVRLATEDDRVLHEDRKLYEKSRKLRDAGRYGEAIPLFERIIETRQRILGPIARDLGTVLHDLAVLYYYQGDDAKAEPLSKRALAIQEKALEPGHPEIAASLNLLALLSSNRGDFAGAEPMFQRAVRMKEESLGPGHPNLAYYLHNLASLYYVKGDYAKAERLYERTLAIREKMLGQEHTLIAQTLNDLALVHYDKGDYQQAELLHQRALSVREKLLPPEHPNIAESLGNLANVYRDRNDYAKAEPLYQRALDIQEKTLGSKRAALAITLNNLARLYGENGEYSKAEPLHSRALAIFESTLGAGHPYVSPTLNHLATLHAAKGDFTGAINFQSRANTVSEHNLVLNLSAGSERQKLVYLASRSKQADRTISFHLRYAPADPSASNMAATMILQRKGRALDATSENLNSLRGRFNPEDRALLDRLTGIRAEIAELVLRGPQNMSAEQYQARIGELEEKADKTENEISRRSSEFRAQSLPITLEAVQSAIPSDAALIEFASYRPFNARAARNEDRYGPPCYAAYVLRREGEIRWRDLGEAKVIDEAIAALREALRDRKREDVKLLARVLDERVFQSIRPLLGGLTRLLISPDGSLNLVPFAALVDEKGKYLVEGYSISYLTSGRDLLSLQVPRESKSGPLVVAAPDFGVRRQISYRKKGKDKSPRAAIRDFFFSPLPYAAQEGNALRSLLPGATLLTKRQASKAALRQVPSPVLLHIATHGFFLEDLKWTSPGGSSYQSLGDDARRLTRQLESGGIRIESPLLRSGLVLAGANEHKHDDSGILTALEMTGLNLWGTKLVVLSACDTGVGEVKNGDGVHGLRRALVLAGAETQVMSLWAVSDKATQELMVSYYRGLQQGQGRSEALRKVQLEMLKNPSRQHPYYWASFILSGESANLEGKT